MIMHREIKDVFTKDFLQGFLQFLIKRLRNLKILNFY
jgi:hypothetical protein